MHPYLDNENDSMKANTSGGRYCEDAPYRIQNVNHYEHVNPPVSSYVASDHLEQNDHIPVRPDL